ncbi:cyclin-dependent kinase C-1 isoform X2 [Beta vulgaris subsp. vulgaris]|uniref:cyclin-dependent kinase C-1 isoform X2 n=1 Tax=Beta vulgaris subsp. vulgaris TaxID=3555 RepID=UPI0020374C27|nr:cyclin-dependent kinase C-1 isoform X2 [Beta vulgaris subsp. vulgaris]
MTVAELGQLNLEELPPLQGVTRTVDCFQKLEQIGEGTYGQVYMAKEVTTGEIVALKRIRTENEKEGFPISAIREIKILNRLHHENIVKLKEVVMSQDGDKELAASKDTSGNDKYNGGVYLVFEYMDHDLTGLSDRPGLRFTVPQIKLLTGLHYCHANEVLHRDIKGANLLLNNNGSLKLADFGLSCSSNLKNGNFTNRVITLPYRPPELLLGATNYGPAVDVWSAGCIFAELLHGKPIMYGRNEPEQLHKIFEVCGSPDEVNWPGVSKIRWYNNFKPARPMRRRLREVFRHFDAHALDLLDKMLILDPSKRISANDALAAEYFRMEPLPCDPKSLPKYESSHEFQTKRKRQQQRLKEETARRQNLPCPQPHARLPPIQNSGHIVQGHRHSMNQLPRPIPTGPPSNTYGDPLVAGLSNRFPASGNPTTGYVPTHSVQAQAGGMSTGPYPPHVRAAPYAVNNMTNRSSTPSYVPGPPGFSHRPPNPMASNRNQQYGWQQ